MERFLPFQYLNKWRRIQTDIDCHLNEGGSRQRLDS